MNDIEIVIYSLPFHYVSAAQRLRIEYSLESMYESTESSCESNIRNDQIKRQSEANKSFDGGTNRHASDTNNLYACRSLPKFFDKRSNSTDENHLMSWFISRIKDSESNNKDIAARKLSNGTTDASNENFNEETKLSSNDSSSEFSKPTEDHKTPYNDSPSIVSNRIESDILYYPKHWYLEEGSLESLRRKSTAESVQIVNQLLEDIVKKTVRL